jgi:hypothetical protein
MSSGGRDFAPAGLFQQYPPKADDPLSVAIRRGGNGCFWRKADAPAPGLPVGVSGLSGLKRPAETEDILTTYVVTSSVASHHVLPGK